MHWGTRHHTEAGRHGRVRRLAPFIDVLFGNEEDFTAALGFEVAGMDKHMTEFEAGGFKNMISNLTREFPFRVVAAKLVPSKASSTTC